jgi:hypothetical protein
VAQRPSRAALLTFIPIFLQIADGVLSGAVLLGEAVELVNQRLGMNPAQAMRFPPPLG